MRKLHNRDANAVERVRLALELRRQRLTYDEIATRCGYATRDAARKAILRELERCIVPEVNEYRQQELEILDAIHQKIWPLVMNNPKGKPDLFAVDRLLLLSKARRELLNLDLKPDEIPANTVLIREIPSGYLNIPTEATKDV